MIALPPLVLLVRSCHGLNAREIAGAVRARVREGGGVWMDPADVTPGGFGDHLFTVHLHGITAAGLDAEEACRNWLSLARRAIAATHAVAGAAPAPAEERKG